MVDYCISYFYLIIIIISKYCLSVLYLINWHPSIVSQSYFLSTALIQFFLSSKIKSSLRVQRSERTRENTSFYINSVFLTHKRRGYIFFKVCLKDLSKDLFSPCFFSTCRYTYANKRKESVQGTNQFDRLNSFRVLKRHTRLVCLYSGFCSFCPGEIIFQHLVCFVLVMQKQI